MGTAGFRFRDRNAESSAAPREHQFLPESQLDRFMICLSMGYPSHQDAVSILKGEVWKQAQERRRVLTAEELKQLQKETEQIYVHDAVYDYIVSLVEETRKPGLFAEGASPRASIALLRMARSDGTS